MTDADAMNRTINELFKYRWSIDAQKLAVIEKLRGLLNPCLIKPSNLPVIFKPCVLPETPIGIIKN